MGLGGGACRCWLGWWCRNVEYSSAYFCFVSAELKGHSVPFRELTHAGRNGDNEKKARRAFFLCRHLLIVVVGVGVGDVGGGGGLRAGREGLRVELVPWVRGITEVA